MTQPPEGGTRREPYAYFNEEHEMFRASVRRFCQERIAPHAEEWERAGEFPKELFREAAELGLFGIRSDPKYGGAGMDWRASAAAYDALRHSDLPSVNIAWMAHADLAIPAIEQLGSEAQKQEFLGPAIAGEQIGALAISEPGAGSDVAGMRTTARREGGEWVISGQKLWITNGALADFLVLAVRTAEDPHKGVSLMLFPTRTAGFKVGKKLSKVGHLASDTAELFFDECRIPESCLLGRENRGFYYIMKNFLPERMAVSLMALSFIDRSIELAEEYGRSREAFGGPVGELQVWRHRFAEMSTNAEAGRWLAYRAADLLNGGVAADREVTMAKLYLTELAQRVTYDCMQIFGGVGYTTEYPIGRIWRDMRLYTIGGGTSEIMKEILSKRRDR